MSLSSAECVRKNLAPAGRRTGSQVLGKVQEASEKHDPDSIQHDSPPTSIVVGRKAFRDQGHAVRAKGEKDSPLTTNEEAVFARVMNDIQTELANIGPYPEAERLGNPQRGREAAKFIALAQAQDEKRSQTALRKKIKQMAACQFMRLPFDIRLRILDFAIDPIPRVRNQQLKLESLIVTIEKTTFNVHSTRAYEGLDAWLSTIDLTKLEGDTSYEIGYDAVKALNFSEFDHLARMPQGPIALAGKCKNLQRLVLKLDHKELVTSVHESHGFEPRDVDHIRAKHFLEGVLDLKCLTDLCFEVRPYDQIIHWDNESYDEYITARTKSTNDLASWLRHEFEKRKQGCS